jgi:hypothetical protein
VQTISANDERKQAIRATKQAISADKSRRPISADKKAISASKKTIMHSANDPQVSQTAAVCNNVFVLF